MDKASEEDWKKIYEEVVAYQSEMPLRMVSFLRELEKHDHAFAINQLQHSLQIATRAHRDGADKELVLCALLHDVGKVLTTANHGAIIAEALKPFISEDNYNILKYHQEFQGRHYYSKVGKDETSYLQFKEEPWFENALKFGDWDQQSFDPDYPSESLEFFLPILKELLCNFPMVWQKKSA